MVDAPEIEPTTRVKVVSREGSLINLLAKKIIGRSAATKALVPYVYMYESGLASQGRRTGVFLLLGATGTGKTTQIVIVIGGGLSDNELTISAERHSPILYRPVLAPDLLNLIRGPCRRTLAAAAGSIHTAEPGIRRTRFKKRGVAVGTVNRARGTPYRGRARRPPSILSKRPIRDRRSGR